MDRSIVILYYIQRNLVNFGELKKKFVKFMEREQNSENVMNGNDETSRMYFSSESLGHQTYSKL